MEITVKIIDPIGLHARPAAELVQIANKYKSAISLKMNDKEANAKSIITIMALGVKKNAEVTIVANGDDEVEAIEAIQKQLLASKIIG